MYIQYTRDQLCLPMDLEDDIPEHHLVREKQPGIPAISASRHGESDARVGWLFLAHNLLKQAAIEQKRRAAILQ